MQYGLSSRDAIVYTADQLIAELTNAINVNYTSFFTSKTKTYNFIDSMVIPKQGNTFNENSTVYSLDFIKYIIKTRCDQINNSASKLCYIKMDQGPYANDAQKFYINSVFATNEAAPTPVVFEDITYKFDVDYFNPEKSIHNVLMSAVNNYFGIPGVSSNIYLTDFTTIGQVERYPKTVFPRFVNEVDIPVEIGFNPNFEHKDCISEIKLLERPMVYRFYDYDYDYSHSWGYFYNKSEVEFYYAYAKNWFVQIKPQGYMFLRSNLGAALLLTQFPFGQNYGDNTLTQFGEHNYDCTYDVSQLGSFPHIGYLQTIIGDCEAYYGDYAKINYRTGTEPDHNSIYLLNPNMPIKSNYSL